MPQRHTRPEQLARAEATAKAKIDEEKRKLAAVQSAQRAEAKKARNQRRFHVGTLADQAGLLALDDALLTEMFALLARLAQHDDPHGTLAACLRTIAGTPGTSVEGCAHAEKHGVSAAHS
jgi:hypothetical protein